MKRTLMAFAIVCLGGIAARAQTGEVYSLNVVGFQKLTAVSQGLVLVSTPFERSPNTLDDVIGAQLTGGKSEGSADQVIMWDPTNQSYRIYWLKSTDSNWYSLDGARATNAIVIPSSGFWIRNKRLTNQIVIVSGDVVTAPAVTNVLVPGLNLMSYPYSSAIDINNSALTNGKAGKSEGSADMIVMWDPQLQMYVQYWLKSDKKWYTLGGTLASNVVVGGGRGFWYRNRNTNSFVWVEAKPYSL